MEARSTASVSASVGSGSRDKPETCRKYSVVAVRVTSPAPGVGLDWVGHSNIHNKHILIDFVFSAQIRRISPRRFAHAEDALYKYFSKRRSLCGFPGIKSCHGNSAGSQQVCVDGRRRWNYGTFKLMVYPAFSPQRVLAKSTVFELPLCWKQHFQWSSLSKWTPAEPNSEQESEATRTQHLMCSSCYKSENTFLLKCRVVTMQHFSHVRGRCS